MCTPVQSIAVRRVDASRSAPAAGVRRRPTAWVGKISSVLEQGHDVSSACVTEQDKPECDELDQRSARLIARRTPLRARE